MKNLQNLLPVMLLAFVAALISACAKTQPALPADDGATQSSETGNEAMQPISEPEQIKQAPAEVERNPSIRDIDMNQFFIKPSRFIAEEKQLSASYSVYDYTDLYALGFSRDGKFACILHEEWEGTGSSRATFIIQDLVSDEIVLTLPGDDEDVSEDVVFRFIQTYGESVDAALLEHGITLSPCAYNSFPYDNGDTKLDMYVSIVPTGEMLHEIVPFVSYECVAVDSAGRKKIVTSKQDTALDDVFVCGWMQSPYEKRLAVVLAEKAFGFEGCDLHYRLCGCSLTAGFVPEETMNITVTIGEKDFAATFSDCATTRALAAKFPLAVDMSELNGNEYYVYLDDSLPTEDKNPLTIAAGDIKLYGSNCLVIFYKSFSTGYSYTTLGTISDTEGLLGALKASDGNVIFSLNAIRVTDSGQI